MAKHHGANNIANSRNFLEKVYHSGLEIIIQNAPSPQIGAFGKTTLTHFVQNGVLIVRLKCFAKDFGHIYSRKKYTDFADFSIRDDGEGSLALFLEGCATWMDLPPKMLNDVIEHWPIDVTAQQAVFHPVSPAE